MPTVIQKQCDNCTRSFDVFPREKSRRFCCYDCCRTYRQSQSKTQRNKNCLHCHTALTGKYHNKFCSKSCAGMHNNQQHGTKSQEVKDKISAALKGRPSPKKGIPSPNYGKTYNRSTTNDRSRMRVCPVCSTEFQKNRVTCSRSCFKIRATENALKQEKHGGGHKGRYKGFNCDSTYELAFLVWHLDHNIPISRCTNVYDYYYEGKSYKYKPDFVVESVEIEIKGFMSKRAEAKCLQNPHIFVVDKNMIKGYVSYVKQAYQVRDLRDLYEAKIHRKECIRCKTIYTPGYSNQKYCSHACSTTRPKDPAHIEKIKQARALREQKIKTGEIVAPIIKGNGRPEILSNKYDWKKVSELIQQGMTMKAVCCSLNIPYWDIKKSKKERIYS